MRALILAFVLLMTGCATQSGNYYQSWQSPELAELPTDSLKVVADDFRDQLYDFYAPGSTTLSLEPVESAPVVIALELSLRTSGYAVTTLPESNAVPLAITVTDIDNQVLTVLVHGDHQVSRLYDRLEDNSLVAASPFTVRGGNNE